MSAKEKAKELVLKFLEKIPFADTNVYKDWKKEMYDKAKQCALIAVDEILSMGWNLPHYENIDGKTYWQQVKTEIGNL